MMDLNKTYSGQAVLAAIVSVFILGVFGIGVGVFNSANQTLRINQITNEEAYYSLQAGIEFAQKKIREATTQQDINNLIGVYEFAQGTFNIVYDGVNTLTITASRINSNLNYKVNIPSPIKSQAQCLIIDTSGAYISNKNLSGIVLKRDPTCNISLTITALTPTWSPNYNERMKYVQIKTNPLEYSNATGVLSGEKAIFNSSYTINDNANHNLNYIQWDINLGPKNFDPMIFEMSDGSTKTFSVNLLANDQANCLAVDTSAAYIGDSNYRDLLGLTISNNCNQAIIIDRIKTSWSPLDPSRKLQAIQIAASPIEYSNATGENSGVDININDFSLSAQTGYSLTYIRFSQNMLGRDFIIEFTMQDGTKKEVNVDIFADDMASCLNINASTLSIGGANNAYLYGMKLSVDGACVNDIVIDKLTLSWIPTTPQRALKQVRIGGATVWSGTAASGTEVDLTTNVLLQAQNPEIDVDYFRFSSDMSTVLRQFTIIFTMLDGTTKTKSFTTATEGDCLTIDTTGAQLNNGYRRLTGIVLSNVCTFSIELDKITTNWDPITPARTLQAIKIGGTTIWTGSANSGETEDIQNGQINSSQSININYFEFDSNMQGRTFNLTFIMVDGTTKNAVATP